MGHTLSFSCTLRDLLASLLIYINLAMFTLEFSRIVAVSATSGFRNRMVYHHFLINRIYGYPSFLGKPSVSHRYGNPTRDSPPAVLAGQWSQ